MQHFFVAVFLVTISGLLQETNGCDSVVNKTGYINGTVVLPCNCSICSNCSKWQKGDERPVCKFIKKRIQPLKGYENRVEHIPSETDGDCSIRLKNITAADNGTYECSFENRGYKKHCVNLEVKQEPSQEVKQKPSAGNTSESKELRRVYLSVFPVFALLLVVGALGNAYFKQRRETIKDYITSP